VCKEGGASTKYTEHQCLTASGTGAWGWEEVKGTERVKGVGLTLVLRDIKATGGSAGIQCTGGTGEGIVGPGNKSEVLTAKVEVSKCSRLEGACKTGEIEEVAGVHLPWQTEIFDTEGRVIGKLSGAGNGEPGWKVKCKTLLGSETDECVAETGRAESGILENKATKNGTTVELLVLVTPELSGSQQCTQGGKESGEIRGLGAVLSVSGSGLRVH
jgi:hypothetical protein